jgi:GNAT superfamily N-acetyltransferase
MDTFRISTDLTELDIALIHRFLSEESHWAKGVTVELVRKSLSHSLCFGGFVGASQVAFARVVTDYSRLAYVMDVFVAATHRGNGYSKALMRAMLAHPELEGVTFLLRTSNAHGLYTQLGFTALPNPDKYLRYSPYDQSLWSAM